MSDNPSGFASAAKETEPRQDAADDTVSNAADDTVSNAADDTVSNAADDTADDSASQATDESNDVTTTRRPSADYWYKRTRRTEEELNSVTRELAKMRAKLDAMETAQDSAADADAYAKAAPRCNIRFVADQDMQVDKCLRHTRVVYTCFYRDDEVPGDGAASCAACNAGAVASRFPMPTSRVMPRVFGGLGTDFYHHITTYKDLLAIMRQERYTPGRLKLRIDDELLAVRTEPDFGTLSKRTCEAAGLAHVSHLNPVSFLMLPLQLRLQSDHDARRHGRETALHPGVLANAVYKRMHDIQVLMMKLNCGMETRSDDPLRNTINRFGIASCVLPKMVLRPSPGMMAWSSNALDAIFGILADACLDSDDDDFEGSGTGGASSSGSAIRGGASSSGSAISIVISGGSGHSRKRATDRDTRATDRDTVHAVRTHLAQHQRRQLKRQRT